MSLAVAVPLPAGSALMAAVTRSREALGIAPAVNSRLKVSASWAGVRVRL